MKLEITREDVWAATIKDQPAGLAVKLEALAQAGSNLEFAIARRAPKKPGTGVLFITPIKGARQIKAAKKAGFNKTKSMHALRIAATDKPGLAADISRRLADAGINLHGFSAAAIGKKAIFNIALDKAADINKARRSLK